MTQVKRYFKEIFLGFSSLWSGLRLTLHNFTHPRKEIITEQYPENRTTTINIPERFAGEVILPHDENNQHKCTACTLCEMACPNGSIKIIPVQMETEDGKKKSGQMGLQPGYVYVLWTMYRCLSSKRHYL
jgi:NADH-quinone oxidoreductase subunit I